MYRLTVERDMAKKYDVITLTPKFKVKARIVGENSLDRANLLVEKNKKTLEGYGIPCSVFIRRVKKYNGSGDWKLQID